MGRDVAALVAAGLFLLGCGGEDVEPIIDPAGPWATVREMTGPMQETAVAALGGQVYVIGGLSTEEGVVASVDVYDAANDAWSAG